MKCPFMEETQSFYEVVNGNPIKTKESTQMSECYGDECPFYDNKRIKCGRIELLNKGAEKL